MSITLHRQLALDECSEKVVKMFSLKEGCQWPCKNEEEKTR